MKSSFLIIASLLIVTGFCIQPAVALSTDHDSAYANASGSSRFSDPDDQLSGNQFGSVQFGSSSSSDGSIGGGSVTFGMFSTGGQSNNQLPELSVQSCVTGTGCQR